MSKIIKHVMAVDLATWPGSVWFWVIGLLIFAWIGRAKIGEKTDWKGSLKTLLAGLGLGIVTLVLKKLKLGSISAPNLLASFPLPPGAETRIFLGIVLVIVLVLSMKSLPFPDVELENGPQDNEFLSISAFILFLGKGALGGVGLTLGNALTYGPEFSSYMMVPAVCAWLIPYFVLPFLKKADVSILVIKSEKPPKLYVFDAQFFKNNVFRGKDVLKEDHINWEGEVIIYVSPKPIKWLTSLFVNPYSLPYKKNNKIPALYTREHGEYRMLTLGETFQYSVKDNNEKAKGPISKDGSSENADDPTDIVDADEKAVRYRSDNYKKQKNKYTGRLSRRNSYQEIDLNTTDTWRFKLAIDVFKPTSWIRRWLSESNDLDPRKNFQENSLRSNDIIVAKRVFSSE